MGRNGRAVLFQRLRQGIHLLIGMGILAQVGLLGHVVEGAAQSGAGAVPLADAVLDVECD